MYFWQVALSAIEMGKEGEGGRERQRGPDLGPTEKGGTEPLKKAAATVPPRRLLQL